MYITFVFLDTRPYEWPGQAKQKSTRKYRWGMTNLQRRGCLQSALPLSGDDLGGHASSRFVNSLVYLESYILEGRESRVDGSASGCSIQPASQPASQPVSQIKEQRAEKQHRAAAAVARLAKSIRGRRQDRISGGDKLFQVGDLGNHQTRQARSGCLARPLAGQGNDLPSPPGPREEVTGKTGTATRLVCCTKEEKKLKKKLVYLDKYT